MAEIGDKSALLVIFLAIKYQKPFIVWLGVLSGSLINQVMAVSASGLLVTLVNDSVIELVVAMIFVLLGSFMLYDSLVNPHPLIGHEPKSSTEKSIATGGHIYLQSATLFFLAEMGDKTQLATITLAAHYRDPFMVGFGSYFAMAVVSGAAILASHTLILKIPGRLVQKMMAAIFIATGGGLLLRAWL